MMKSPTQQIVAIACYFIAVISAPSAYADEVSSSAWEGVWFTCEFAQRQRAPDDGCVMFDDEGFSYHDGQLSYLRMQGSVEEGCRGNKIGQCFKRDSDAISVTAKEIGKARIEDDRLIVRYWGCEQSYRIFEGSDYMTVKPLGKSCLWSQERHFYIAPFTGRIQQARK